MPRVPCSPQWQQASRTASLLHMFLFFIFSGGYLPSIVHSEGRSLRNHPINGVVRTESSLLGFRANQIVAKRVLHDLWSGPSEEQNSLNSHYS